MEHKCLGILLHMKCNCTFSLCKMSSEKLFPKVVVSEKSEETDF